MAMSKSKARARARRNVIGGLTKRGFKLNPNTASSFTQTRMARHSYAEYRSLDDGRLRRRRSR